jgi:hypothetical protein
MMTQEDAVKICNELWMDSELTDPQLGAHSVIRDLVRIAQNETSPLAAVEAMEILIALDPEMPLIPRELAGRTVKQLEELSNEKR